MSIYVYRCDVCGEESEEEYPIGTARRIQACPCQGVQRLVIQSPNIAAAALPNKMHGVRAIDAKEARWQKDMPAYKQLRADGLQPSSIDGADKLAATARDRIDVEHAKTLERVEEHYKIPRSESKPRMQEALASIHPHPAIDRSA